MDSLIYGKTTDLRRIGALPGHGYPVAQSDWPSLRKRLGARGRPLPEHSNARDAAPVAGCGSCAAPVRL